MLSFFLAEPLADAREVKKYTQRSIKQTRKNKERGEFRRMKTLKSMLQKLKLKMQKYSYKELKMPIMIQTAVQ